MKSQYVIDELFQQYPKLIQLKEVIFGMADAIIKTYKNGGKVLVCGNGGSAADADHIVGELMKSFEENIPLPDELQKKLLKVDMEKGKKLAFALQHGRPAISLSAHHALVTAILNDIGGEFIFAQQVVGYGSKGDVLIGLSTSGESTDVINAFIVARAKGIKTIGMTGSSGGELIKYCDISIKVPEDRTARVQELHLPIYHAVCQMVEIEI